MSAPARTQHFIVQAVLKRCCGVAARTDVESVKIRDLDKRETILWLLSGIIGDGSRPDATAQHAKTVRGQSRDAPLRLSPRGGARW